MNRKYIKRKDLELSKQERFKKVTKEETNETLQEIIQRYKDILSLK